MTRHVAAGMVGNSITPSASRLPVANQTTYVASEGVIIPSIERGCCLGARPRPVEQQRSPMLENVDESLQPRVFLDMSDTVGIFGQMHGQRPIWTKQAENELRQARPPMRIEVESYE
ncbi:hypothetical protein SDC9_144884 [bioreactor metagenome]|uniref:Uncharacterized protein n=1 Tax=bioreactor metagenome TaxID=1076179 RepID=A0A645E7B5_9ZZZZ